MKILKIHEQEDNGYVTMECEFDPDEVNLLLNYAVVDILTKEVERINDEYGSNRNNGEVQSA